MPEPPMKWDGYPNLRKKATDTGQGARVDSAGDPAYLRRNQRLGADFDADLRLGTRPPPAGPPQVDAVRCLFANAADAQGDVLSGRPWHEHRAYATAAATRWPTPATTPGRCRHGWDTKTSSTPCGIPSWRRTGSRTSGGRLDRWGARAQAVPILAHHARDGPLASC
jgi:hypothetical protein